MDSHSEGSRLSRVAVALARGVASRFRAQGVSRAQIKSVAGLRSRSEGSCVFRHEVTLSQVGCAVGCDSHSGMGRVPRAVPQRSEDCLSTGHAPCPNAGEGRPRIPTPECLALPRLPVLRILSDDHDENRYRDDRQHGRDESALSHGARVAAILVAQHLSLIHISEPTRPY